MGDCFVFLSLMAVVIIAGAGVMAMLRLHLLYP